MCSETVKFPNFLEQENQRNTNCKDLFTGLVRRMTKNPACEVLIGHHIAFLGNTALGNDVVIEIPSADSLMFSHEIMEAVFGDAAIGVMIQLAMVPPEGRAAALERHLVGIVAK